MKNLLIFTQELSTLVSAGLPIDRSLQILGTVTENRRLKEAVKDILTRIEGGNSLAEALGNHPRIFSETVHQHGQGGRIGGISGGDLIPPGQISSKLERDPRLPGLRHDLPHHFDRWSAGCPWPFWLPLSFPGLPRSSRIWGRAIPLPTQIMLSISQSARDYWWAGLGAIALVYLGMKVYTTRTRREGFAGIFPNCAGSPSEI